VTRCYSSYLLENATYKWT